VRPRSGLALKNGIVLPDSPGTIDEDYRGELQVIVMNAGTEPFTMTGGCASRQAILAPVVRLEWHGDRHAAGDSEAGGFGSTGDAAADLRPNGHDRPG
jgi:dUTP pyrophosphatase